MGLPRFGNRAVLVCKLLPGVRAFGSYPAGVTRMNFGVFVAYTTLGSALFCTSFAALGFHLGKHWDLIIEQIKPFIESMTELMEKQESASPRKLTRQELLDLADVLENACHRLVRRVTLRIP